MRVKIREFEDYTIDTNGNVYNKNNTKLKESIGENGYHYYRLSKNGVKKMFYAHRLVALHFIDNPFNLPVVNHLDGNKLNNSVENLEWASYSQNTVHWHQTKHNTRKNDKQLKENLQGERWIEIPKFEHYQISNYGRVYSAKTNRILKPSLASGYLKVGLSKNGKKQDFFIHRLVYSTFNKDFDLTDNVIDHIDGNKTNNVLSNLRKVSLSENVKSALYKTKTNKSVKTVYQYTQDLKLIKSFESIANTSRELKLDSSSITKACKGKIKTCGGFIFAYEPINKNFNDYPEIASEE